MSIIADKITKTKESDPVPSSPKRPPVINLFMVTDDGRRYQWPFAAVHAARRAVDYLISDRTHKWVDDNTIRIDGPEHSVTLHTDCKPDGLTVVMEHEFTQKEKDWPLQPDHLTIGAAMFRSRERQFFDPPEDEAPTLAKHKRKKRQSSEDSENTPIKRKRKARTGAIEDSQDAISIQSIANGLGMSPREARGILRKTNTPKPKSGKWEFTKDEADAIRTLLKENSR